MKGRVGLGIVLAVVCVVVLPTLARGEAVDFRDDFADASKVGASSGILYVLGAVTLPPVFPARHGVVLPRGTGGDVDASGVVPGSVLFEGGLYKIWYGACCGGGASSIAYATSTDGIAWTKQGAVVTPSLPAEAAGISYVEVVKVGATYWMWYAGLDGTYYRILAATSADGIAWTKRGVVLDVGAPGSSDDRYLWRPSAVYDGSNFRLWYTGNSFSNQANRIFYATSPDGLNWTKRGIAIPSGWQPPNDSAQTAMPEVRLVGGLYVMLYTGSDGAVERILGAESDDGITWRRGGLLLDTTPRESRVSDAAMLVRPDGSWLVYYASDSSAWQGFLAIRPAWSGWIRSISITKPDRATWARFNVTAPAPTGSSVRVTVRDAGSLAVVGGLENVTGGAVNLSGVDSAQHPTLVVEAWLRATAFAPPSLDSWEVSSPDLPATPTPLELPVLPFAIVIIAVVVGAILIAAYLRRRRSAQMPPPST